jgi:hypothetical protein
VFEEFGAEDVVISRVAEDVERFVRVFDCQLDYCRVVEACCVDSVVEVDAVSGALVRRDNQELGDAQPRWELSRADEFWCREGGVLWSRLLGAVYFVEPPFVGGRVSDNRVL